MKYLLGAFLALVFVITPLPANGEVTIIPTEYGEPVMIGTQIGPTYFTPKAIVIHHSADAGVTPENEATHWEGYRHYHMETVHPGVYPEWIGIYPAQQDYPDGLSWPNQKDYNDIDYHFGIGPSGTVYPGRDARTIGWHAGGALPGKPEINTYALGVCFMGDFTYNPPNSTQYWAGVKLVANLCIQYHITFDQIYGHKEIRGTTSCPGNAFPLAQFKEDVRMQIAGFWDVSYNDWFWEALKELTSSGIVRGYDDKTFRPNQYITRAEFVYMLWKASGSPASTSTFPDTQTHWAREAIGWAIDNKLINGLPDGNFYPDWPVTRAAMAKITYFYKPTFANRYYADVSFSHWAFGYITANAYMTGYSDGTFRPDNPTTRAEACAVIARIIK